VVQGQTDRVEKQTASSETQANRIQTLSIVRAQRVRRHEGHTHSGHQDERGRESGAEYSGGRVEQTIPEPMHHGFGIHRAVVVHRDDAEKSESPRDVGGRPTSGG
jgi:hypothetical protein